MPKLHVKPTTAGNLEAKFDAGEDVLDYFDLRAAKVVLPKRPVATKSKRLAAAAQRPPESEFQRALAIVAQIEKLGSELRSILGKQGVKSGNFGTRKAKIATV